MGFLDERDRQPEIMDQPGLDISRHQHALRGLGRINFLSGSAGMLWRPLKKLLQGRSQPLRVLDVASGGGDVTLGLWRKAQRAGLPMEIRGCDVSETALTFAREQAERAEANVEFFPHDALQGELPECDVAFSSLFLHHLDQDEAVAFLARLGRAAREMVLVNDLQRSRLGYFLAYWGTRLLSRSEVTHVDGPLSVQGAFTAKEAEQLANEAGLNEATATRHWPCRYLLMWRRNA